MQVFKQNNHFYAGINGNRVTSKNIVALQQGCPILLLAIDCPANFSSNSNQTQLKQLIKVFRIAWILKAGVFD